MQLLGQFDLVALIGADKQVAREGNAAVLLLVRGQEIVDGGELGAVLGQVGLFGQCLAHVSLLFEKIESIFELSDTMHSPADGQGGSTHDGHPQTASDQADLQATTWRQTQGPSTSLH